MCDKLHINTSATIKEDLVTHIHEWLAHPDRSLPQNYCVVVNTQDERVPNGRGQESVTRPTYLRCPHVDYYCSFYSLQDHANRTYYSCTTGGLCHTADTALIFIILYQGLSACFVAWLEHKMVGIVDINEKKRIKEDNTWWDFMLELTTQISSNRHHRPTLTKQQFALLLLSMHQIQVLMRLNHEGASLTPLPRGYDATSARGKAIIKELRAQNQRLIVDLSKHPVLANIVFDPLPLDNLMELDVSSAPCAPQAINPPLICEVPIPDLPTVSLPPPKPAYHLGPNMYLSVRRTSTRSTIHKPRASSKAIAAATPSIPQLAPTNSHIRESQTEIDEKNLEEEIEEDDEE
jgi:hypothetical protein